MNAAKAAKAHAARCPSRVPVHERLGFGLLILFSLLALSVDRLIATAHPRLAAETEWVHLETTWLPLFPLRSEVGGEASLVPWVQNGGSEKRWLRMLEDPWGEYWRLAEASNGIPARFIYSLGPNQLDERGAGDDLRIARSPAPGFVPKHDWHRVLVGFRTEIAWGLAACSFWILCVPLGRAPRARLRRELLRAFGIALPPVIALAGAIAWITSRRPVIRWPESPSLALPGPTPFLGSVFLLAFLAALAWRLSRSPATEEPVRAPNSDGSSHRQEI